MGAIHEIVFDCHQPKALAQFWATLLDGYDMRPQDDNELARLADMGLDPADLRSVMLDGPGPSLCFQNVEGQQPDNNRVHFEIAVPNRAGEVARLQANGAEIERVLPTYTVMKDPEGNQFCLVDRHVQHAAVAA